MFFISGPVEASSAFHRFTRTLLFTTAYAALVVLLVSLVTVATGRDLLTEQAFLNWDTEHYASIRQQGYTFLTTAFFPLFPWLWRIVDVSARGMALVNLGLFVLAFSLLSTWFRWSWREGLVAASTPMLCFMGLAYSEALFFVAGVLVLRGWQQQQAGWLGLGLLLCGLTRSAAFVLVPAAIATAYLTRSSWVQFWQQTGLAVGASAAGLLLSIYTHFLDTGRWFVFFKAQRQVWHNELRWPSFPLSSWGGDFSTRCEAITFLAAVAAGLYLLRLVLRRATLQPAAQWAPILFSLLYIVGVAGITLATKGGQLVSLSRYVWATPFGVLALVWLFRTVPATTRVLCWAMGAAQVCWLVFFASYGHIHTLLMYLLTGTYVVLLLANAHVSPVVRRGAFWGTMAVNTGLLVFLTTQFLQHKWVG